MGDQEKTDNDLNDNLGDFIDCLAAIEPKNNGSSSWKTWNEENWEEEFDKHPFFRKTPIEPGEELSEEMEAMMAMKWDIDDPDEKAEEYKKEGNEMFRLKKYRFAINSYTEGIKEKCKNKELKAILYTNRAASHFHLENWRSSLMDSVCARKFRPTHKKAIMRGIDCCLKLSMFEEAIKWCDAGLILNSKDENILSMRHDAEKKKKIQDRDKRKKQLELRKEHKRKMALIHAVTDRGLQFGNMTDVDSDIDLQDVSAVDALDLSALESHHPSGSQVTVDEDGVMHWPVMFLYPEYGETDFIQAFNENITFINQVTVMFNEDRPAWDAEKYQPKNLVVYYEDKLNTRLIPVSQSKTLLEILREDTHRIYGGTPTFIVLPNNCRFFTEYLKHYERNT